MLLGNSSEDDIALPTNLIQTCLCVGVHGGEITAAPLKPENYSTSYYGCLSSINKVMVWMKNFFKKCLILFACDGASVMLGRKEGVATEMKKIFSAWFMCTD